MSGARNNKTNCCVPQCTSYGKTNPPQSFHKFPGNGSHSEVIRRQEWIRNLRIGKKVTDRMRVCSKHFKPTDFFFAGVPCRRFCLKKNAVPSQCLPLTSTETVEKREKKVQLAQIREQRCANRYKKKSTASQELTTTNVIQNTDEENRTPTAEFLEDRKTCSTAHKPSKVNLLTCAGTIVDDDDKEEGENQMLTTDSLKERKKSAHNFLTCADNLLNYDDAEDLKMTAAEALLELSNASEVVVDIDNMTEEHMVDKATQVTSGDFQKKIMLSIEKLSEKQLNSLTGIITWQIFNSIILCVAEVLKVKPNRHLSVKERVVLTMMKLKLNLSFVVLSILFGCTSTTCKTIFAETVPALAAVLQAAITWSTKEEVLKNLPKCFKKTPNVRVVLDCTEIRIERPKCLRCQIMTYSTYKSGHTAKYMVCSTPDGVISFISNGYGGRASDRIIFQQSGIIDMLEPCIDSIMVDKGFLIEDLCDEKLVTLVRPPFLKKGKTQLSALEADQTRNVARARIHIERAIQRIKIFKMIHVGMVPWNLINLLDDILIIACGVSNLSAPILSPDKF